MFNHTIIKTQKDTIVVIVNKFSDTLRCLQKEMATHRH